MKKIINALQSAIYCETRLTLTDKQLQNIKGH